MVNFILEVAAGSEDWKQESSATIMSEEGRDTLSEGQKQQME
jgi:hypothetical protein